MWLRTRVASGKACTGLARTVYRLRRLLKRVVHGALTFVAHGGVQFAGVGRASRRWDSGRLLALRLLRSALLLALALFAHDCCCRLCVPTIRTGD